MEQYATLRVFVVMMIIVILLLTIGILLSSDKDRELIPMMITTTEGANGPSIKEITHKGHTYLWAHEYSMFREVGYAGLAHSATYEADHD